MMGGEIKVASEFGRGTTFIVTLPLSLDGKAGTVPPVKTGEEEKSV
jgi:signal transduction histidine kinase